MTTLPILFAWFTLSLSAWILLFVSIVRPIGLIWQGLGFALALICTLTLPPWFAIPALLLHSIALTMEGLHCWVAHMPPSPRPVLVDGYWVMDSSPKSE